MASTLVATPHSVPPTSGSSSRRPDESDLVVVGLGANLGAARETLRWAHDALVTLSSGRVGVSSLYRSAPVGPQQPDFYNAAVLLSWPGPLLELLRQLQELEAAAGRVRTVRWGPRTLDLDILWAGTRVSATFELAIPHPELKNRKFALLPLLDLVPQASDPSDGVAYRHALERLGPQRIVRAYDKSWVKTVG